MRQRVAVVTGSSGGIGTATVACFQEAGWYVVGLDRAKPTSPAQPDRFLEVDLADTEAVGEVVQAMVEVEHVDALVNGAALGLDEKLAEISCPEWDLVMAVNGPAPLPLVPGPLSP